MLSPAALARWRAGEGASSFLMLKLMREFHQATSTLPPFQMTTKAHRVGTADCRFTAGNRQVPDSLLSRSERAPRGAGPQCGVFALGLRRTKCRRQTPLGVFAPALAKDRA